MIFRSIKIEKYNQLDYVEINLHPRLTVLTGANGAGKSTILRVFSRMIGWNYNETATPFKGKAKVLKYRIGGRRVSSPKEQTNWISIGTVSFESGNVSDISVPDVVQHANYGMQLNPNFHVKGLNIPSHRTAYSYRQISSIPVRARTRSEAFEMFNNSIMNRIFGNGSEPPSYQMKATLVSLALFGRGNEYVQEDPEALSLFLGFIDVLKLLLPPTLGFENLSIRDGEVILETKSGDFLLDAVSGGIGAILDLAWQIYMFDAGKNEPFVVLIDEAENHLHASMQRRLLPSLIEAFPNAQFIISTHSPLMVNSVKDSCVYVLKYNQENSVVSELLDFENKAANASQILRDVLGVPVTMPIWVENTLTDIITKYQGLGLTPEVYTRLREELSTVGLKDHLPQALGLLQGGE